MVAHPPCGPWGRLRHLYERREHDCAIRAVEQVRQFGGVLEHPRGSKLWDHAGLPAAGAEADSLGGFTLEVEQVAWGHVARKATWLYFVGVDCAHAGATVRYGGTPTHWIEDFKFERPPGIKVCSAQQRRRTPPLFAEWLVGLARGVVLS